MSNGNRAVDADYVHMSLSRPYMYMIVGVYPTRISFVRPTPTPSLLSNLNGEYENEKGEKQEGENFSHYYTRKEKISKIISVILTSIHMLESNNPNQIRI